MSRDADMVAVLLGVVGAGGAYVPLDPEHPADRLAYMAADAGVSLIVANAAGERAVEAAGLDVVRVADLVAGAGECSVTRAAASDLAYVIYTSGSTGRPKGVMVEHQAIVNRLIWMIDEYGFGPGDRVLQKTPYTFDVSVWEFFGTLASGATLVVLPAEHHRDPDLLLQCVQRDEITILHFVPSMLAVFLTTAGVSERTQSIRLVVCSGEALPSATALRSLELLKAQLVNLYGPTEAAVDVTAFTVTGDAVGGSVPIGGPIDNTAMYVVDREGRPQPVGVEGDLLIGGIGLARGYAGAPELTSERFVVDHLGARPGGRLYRTGDRAVWTAAGVLDFRGRSDHQVKLRGLRIELEEIQHAIVDLGLATQAVVSVSGAGEGAFLVAYLVTDREIDQSEFRSELATRVPDYMVPGVLIRLDELPVSANGKLRRDALPEPSFGHEATRELTPAESVIAGIWEEILGVRPVSAEDDFFALGGNSMALVRVSARLRVEFGTSVSLATLLGAASLAGIAEAVRRTAVGEPSTDQPDQPDSPVAASPSQRRIRLAELLGADGFTYNVPLVLRLTGPLDHRRLGDALSRIQSDHSLLSARLYDGPVELMVDVGGTRRFALAVEDLRGAGDEERTSRLERLRQAHATQPFSIESGPLGAATLIRLDEEEHELLLCFHHTAVDAASLAVICRDLGIHYHDPEESNRSEARLDYLDYCRRTSHYRRGDLEWWQAELDGFAGFGLPRAVTTGMARRSGTHEFTVGTRLAEGARHVARQHRATVFTFCLAAWFLALAEESEGRPAVAVQVSTRPAEHTDVVGPFVNQVPMAAPLIDPANVAEYFDQTVVRWREVAQRADVPFDEIASVCGAAMDDTGSVLTQVGFSFAQAVPQQASWGDVTVRTVDTPSFGQAKLPVFMEVEERDDGLRGVIEFRADLHDAAQIARLHASWERSFRSLLMMDAQK